MDKGMEDGQKITFSSEGDQEPGLEPGDIIIVLDEKAHEKFKRSGQDLIVKMDINLTDALTGMKKTIKTLDERTLVIQTVRGNFPTHVTVMYSMFTVLPPTSTNTFV